jgi:hypothetical protein
VLGDRFESECDTHQLAYLGAARRLVNGALCLR